MDVKIFNTTNTNNLIEEPSEPTLPPDTVDDSSGTSDSQTPTLEEPIISTSQPKTIPAPHIILTVASLMEVVNNNIGVCDVCKKCNLRLGYCQKVAVASKLTLNFDYCNDKLVQIELRLKQLERSRHSADRRLAKNRTKANKLRFEIRYLRLKLEKLKN